MGIGAAVRTGVTHAFSEGYELLIRVDGDGQHPASEIKKLLPDMEKGKLDLSFELTKRMKGIFVETKGTIETTDS